MKSEEVKPKKKKRTLFQRWMEAEPNNRLLLEVKDKDILIDEL